MSEVRDGVTIDQSPGAAAKLQHDLGERIAAMQPDLDHALKEATRKLLNDELLLTNFFAAAFMEATGLKPTEAEMVVENLSDVGDGRMGRRIFFRKSTGRPHA